MTILAGVPPSGMTAPSPRPSADIPGRGPTDSIRNKGSRAGVPRHGRHRDKHRTRRRQRQPADRQIGSSQLAPDQASCPVHRCGQRQQVAEQFLCLQAFPEIAERVGGAHRVVQPRGLVDGEGLAGAEQNERRCQRSSFVFFDMTEPSQIPAICEPLFLGARAKVTLSPCMTLDDLTTGFSQFRSSQGA